MSLRTVMEEWSRFFFTPQSPLPIALFRIFHGLTLIATLLLLWPDRLAWYGPRGWVTLGTMQQLEPGPRINVFAWLPQTDFAVEMFFWVFLLSCVLLTIGAATRANSIITFICVASLHERNLFITHGGDTFLRVTSFFLMFAPAGAAFSVDHFLRVRRGKETSEPPQAPWAQRMIQFELTLVYLGSFWWKSLGAPWVDGTALYYVSHLDEVQRFPMPPWAWHPWAAKLGAWFTLALEFALGTLIWFRELRYPLLLVGLLFHLCLEYSLNLPMFQWDMLSAYVLFVRPEDLQRVYDRVRDYTRKASSHPAPLANKSEKNLSSVD